MPRYGMSHPKSLLCATDSCIKVVLFQKQRLHLPLSRLGGGSLVVGAPTALWRVLSELEARAAVALGPK